MFLKDILRKCSKMSKSNLEYWNKKIMESWLNHSRLIFCSNCNKVYSVVVDMAYPSSICTLERHSICCVKPELFYVIAFLDDKRYVPSKRVEVRDWKTLLSDDDKFYYLLTGDLR